MNRKNLFGYLHCCTYSSYCRSGQQDSMDVWSSSENGSHNRHKMTLGVNWAMLGSERDGEIDKEEEKKRAGGREIAWRTN